MPGTCGTGNDNRPCCPGLTCDNGNCVTGPSLPPTSQPTGQRRERSLLETGKRAMSSSNPMSDSHEENKTVDSILTTADYVSSASRGCDEESKRADIVPLTVDNCSVSPQKGTVAIISQDGDFVTFSVSQSFTGCENLDELSWLATDFIDNTNELTCIKESNVKCGIVNTYTAQCENGVAVIDLFAHDGSNKNILTQTDGSRIYVPEACDSEGDETRTCHFRYLLKCKPSLCKEQDSKAHIRHVGSSTKV